MNKQKKQHKLSIEEAHLEFARLANNRVWTLLDKGERSLREDEEMLYAAYASSYHWLYAGGPVHQQRGEYLIARVHMSLALPDQALHHARRCLDLTKQHPDAMKDFDVAFAYEIMARALAMAGDKLGAETYYQRARLAGNQIANLEDKEIFDNDLVTGDWFGLFTQNPRGTS